MKLFLSVVLSFAFVSCSTFTSQESLVSEKKEVSLYQEMKEDIKTRTQDFKKEDVLVVFDIDYTMLQNSIGLGSEAWFYWQEELLSTKSNQKVAKDFDGLLRVQGLLYDMDPMKLTDKNLDKVLASLQEENYKTIVLTSRGPEFRTPTERTLKANGLDFNKTKIGHDIAGKFLPYKLEELSDKDKETLRNNEARPSSYMNGIFMTSGQHKGIMLQSLLKKFDYKPKYVFFVDNHQKQVDRVYDSMNGVTNVVVYRYKGMDQTFKTLQSQSERNKADREWKALEKHLQNLFKVAIP